MHPRKRLSCFTLALVFGAILFQIGPKAFGAPEPPPTRSLGAHPLYGCVTGSGGCIASQEGLCDSGSTRQ